MPSWILGQGFSTQLMESGENTYHRAYLGVISASNQIELKVIYKVVTRQDDNDVLSRRLSGTAH